MQSTVSMKPASCSKDATDAAAMLVERTESCVGPLLPASFCSGGHACVSLCEQTGKIILHRCFETVLRMQQLCLAALR